MTRFNAAWSPRALDLAPCCECGRGAQAKAETDRLRVSLKTARGLARTGRLRASIIGPRIVRVEESEIARFVQATSTKPKLMI